MTQEEKDLLIKDLYGRLPYKPIVQIEGCGILDLRGVDHDDSAELRDRVIVWHGKNYPSSVNSFPIIECKPYLYPLSISSMTKEEIKEYKHLVAFSGSPNGAANFIDWLNAHHFDYRGLIKKGLAIDCTNLNIYNIY